MSFTSTTCSFRFDSSNCSFYESQKKHRKNSQSQTSYMNCLKEEIEKHLQGIQLLSDEKIIMHLKKLKNFKRLRNEVDELKRSLHLIHNQNKKFERMLSISSLQNGHLLLISNSANQKEILPLLKPLIDDDSGHPSASFPSDLLSNKNFVNSNDTISEAKAGSNVEKQSFDTNDDTITNTPDNHMDSNHSSESDSDETIIPEDSLESNMKQLELSSYESSPVDFNTGMLSNANFIVQSSESFQSDVGQQVVPNGPNLPNLEHLEKTNASAQILSINQRPTYKKVFIFDSDSNIWRQSEHNTIGLVEASSQCYNAVTPNVFPQPEHGIFKKPSSLSIRRKISSRPPSSKICSEDERKRIISASYSSAENWSHRGYSDPLEGQRKEIINDTFDTPLQTNDQNVALKIYTSSIQDIINGTYNATENVSRKSCQSVEPQKGVAHFQSIENAAVMQPYIGKEIISDSFNTLYSRETPEHRNYGDFKIQMDSKNINETAFKPNMSSDTGAVKTDNCLEHGKFGKSKSISQLQKPDNESKMMSCKKDEVYELSCLFEKVMTLKDQHNKSNIYKKMLIDVEDSGPRNDPKATLDVARTLRSTFTLHYKQMIRHMSRYLMERDKAWEEFECKMEQPVKMLLQVESVLPQVIQASSAERRLNADSEFKEYLKSIIHDFTPEDLEEANLQQIFCDYENEVEEIVARFRQQLKDTERLQHPVVDRLNNDYQHFQAIVDAELKTN